MSLSTGRHHYWIKQRSREGKCKIIGIMECDGDSRVPKSGKGNIDCSFCTKSPTILRTVLVPASSQAEKAAADIRAGGVRGEVLAWELDLSSLKSVRSFAARFKASRRPLHILMNNGGVRYHAHQLTEDGLELHYQVIIDTPPSAFLSPRLSRGS